MKLGTRYVLIHLDFPSQKQPPNTNCKHDYGFLRCNLSADIADVDLKVITSKH